MTTGAEIGVMRPRAKDAGSPQKLEEPGNRFSPGASRGGQAPPAP